MPRHRATKRTKNPPQPSPSSRVPPPTPSRPSSAGGGFFSTIIQGFAFGTGSSLAHRTVDTVVSRPEPSSNDVSPTEADCRDIYSQYQTCTQAFRVDSTQQCDTMGKQLLNCLGSYPKMNQDPDTDTAIW